MSIRELPYTCQLCGEQLADKDAAWYHECPEWERIVRSNLPTLASHRTIIALYEKVPDGFWHRLIRRGLQMALGPEADLLDGLLKMRRRYSFRLARKIERRQLVPPAVGVRTELERLRRQYEIDLELEKQGAK